VASLLPQRDQDLTTLLEDADKALYAAKNKGRDRAERWFGESSPEAALSTSAKKT
jgi:PleD family two-component response regulator